MVGDESDEQGTAGSHIDVHQLANEAEGDSVTPDRLRGDEQYFPDCRPFLQEGQRPQHVILLTTSAAALLAPGPSPETHNDLSASSSQGGVGICTDTELLVVVDGAICEVSFANLNAILVGHRTIQLCGPNNYTMNVAKSADDREVDAAVDYLRRKLRAAGRKA